MSNTIKDNKSALDKLPVFKRCPSCDTTWVSRDSFLNDPDLGLIGYQAGFRNLTQGLFYFNHSCKSTLTISVHKFEALYEGPVYDKKMAGKEGCPGHCLHKDDLTPCPNECECAYVRAVIQIINNWQKG